MKFALDGEMSAKVDDYTINTMGVPSVVLMERAAYEVASKTAQIAMSFTRKVRICVVCGNGNNGADGVAVSRILTWQGLPVDIIMADVEGHHTKEMELQLNIATNSSIRFAHINDIPEYDIVIDALFGIGLSRDITGKYAQITGMINESRNVVISIDIPSGINAATGQIMGIAVRADATVTFGYNKIGMMLYPGKKYSGDITVADIGFCKDALLQINPAIYYIPEDIDGIPERIADSNKGTYGRTLVIAGSESMSGAAYMSAAAAYRTGSSYVEILSTENNCNILKTLLPEAVVTAYNSENFRDILINAVSRADTIILGPGLSTDAIAGQIVEITVEKAEVPVIIDADAINILAKNDDILKKHKSPVIITPHMGEAKRLSGLSIDELKADRVMAAREISDRYNIVCVLKDSSTVVACNNKVYINNSGCGAMSKAGMGDVLTGVIASMSALGYNIMTAATMGVYVHGLAGELAAEKMGEHSVVATDMLDVLGKVMEKRK